MSSTVGGSTAALLQSCAIDSLTVEIDPRSQSGTSSSLIKGLMEFLMVANVTNITPDIRLRIMMHDQIDYQEFCRRGKRGRKAVASVRGCQLLTVVLRSSDRISE
jgi:hypothetical protein